MSANGAPAVAATPQYKESFPTSWILSTALSRAINRSDNEAITDDSDSSAVQQTPTDNRVRENLPPAALFLQQAGLATPTTSKSPTFDTTPKRRKLLNTDFEDATNQAASKSAAINNTPRRSGRFRSAVKKFLPKFLSDKSTTKHEPEDTKMVEPTPDTSPLNYASQPLPPTFVFRWPGDTPIVQNAPVQNENMWEYPALVDSPAPYSGQSYTLNTEDNSPYPVSSTFGRVPLPASAQPMSASTGYSSQVVSPSPVPSNFGRVPLPASALTGSTDYYSPAPPFSTLSPGASSAWPVSSTSGRVPLPASAQTMSASTGYSPRST